MTPDLFASPATDSADAYLDGAAEMVDDASRWPRQIGLNRSDFTLERGA